MENLQELLNEKQYEAVTSTNKYLRIIAGAGSGKTRVLTYRIAYLIDSLGYYPSSILAITFTNKAAQEIRERIEKTLGMGKLRMTIATFHSFCSRILREDCKAINYPSSFTVIDDDDQKKIIKDIIKDLDLDDKQLKIANCLDYISIKKNKGISPEQELKYNEHSYFGQQRAQIYQEYEDYLKKNFALDFDDLILKSIYIFENYPAILNKWQERVRHILVDEFQDVDANQYKLLKLLAGQDNEVTVVGDPAQTIYTWRGADVSIILNFDIDFAGAKTISLEQNYRSTGNILKIANQLIEHNKLRLKKNLFTEAEPGFEIAKFFGDNEKKEAEYVVDNINDLYDGKTVFYRDCAVLYRTNAQSAAVEQALMSRGINYKVYGGLKFYRRMEIKDCIAYLRLATNLEDNLSCQRLLENTGRGIGKTTFEKIKNNSKAENKSYYFHLRENYNDLQFLYKAKQGTSLQCFVTQIKELHDSLLLEPLKGYQILNDHLHKYGYIDLLLSYEMDEKIDNVNQFIEQMKNFLKQEGATLDEFVQNVTLMSAQDEIDDTSEDFVKLMTIHTAKGLEFNNVFIFGLVDQIFPSMRAIQESRNGIEEERRLFYVAITRARKRLYLSTSGGQSYFGSRQPSRFLKEITLTAQKERIVIRNDNLREVVDTGIRAGSVIKHDVFGEGIVLSEKDGIIDVVFKNSAFGRKTLNAAHKFIHLVK